jgi:hypothetical protein
MTCFVLWRGVGGVAIMRFDVMGLRWTGWLNNVIRDKRYDITSIPKVKKTEYNRYDRSMRVKNRGSLYIPDPGYLLH